MLVAKRQAERLVIGMRIGSCLIVMGALVSALGPRVPQYLSSEAWSASNLPSYASIASGSAHDAFDELIAAAWKARDQRNWEIMAQRLQSAWDVRISADGIERFGEGLYHALTFAQLMSGDLDNALQTARTSMASFGQTSNRQEWIGARLQLADAASQVGDFKTSSECIRQLDLHRQQLGVSTDGYRAILDRATDKEFTFSFRYAYEQFPAAFNGGSVPAFLPRNDLPYQSSTYEVVGAKSFKELRKGEQVWLEVVPNGHAPFYVQGTVKQKAFSFWPDIKALKSAKALSLPSADPYLGESYGVTLGGKGVEISRALKGKTQWDTVRNVARWMDQNIPYVIDGSDKYIVNGDDALEHRKGVCNPRALAAVKLMRLNGVPCRVVRGMGSFVTPPGWHTWIEIRSPLDGSGGKTRWIPTDVGSTITDFPKHLGMQFYPSVAPFSARAFEWEQWYTFNIETVKYSPKKLTLPDTGATIKPL